MENGKTAETTNYEELQKSVLQELQSTQERLNIFAKQFEAMLSAVSGVTPNTRSQEVKILDGAEIAEELSSVISFNFEILWVITKKNCGYTDKYLQEKYTQIAERRKTYKLRCPACQRVIGKGKSRCMYCGSVVKNEGIFSF